MRNCQINIRENTFLAIKCFKSLVLCMFYAVYLCMRRVCALSSSSSFFRIIKEKCRNFVFKVYFLCRKIADIDFFILHQANERIVKAAAKKLKVDMSRFPINMENYANTSAASIPILLDELVQTGRLRKGQKILLAGFGAGLTWAGSILEW